MLKPRDETDLAEAIAGASGPLAIRGGGTRGISVAGEGLSTAGLSGITLYEPGALTLVAKAGTPVAEIEAALAGENQMLAFEPMDHRALMGTDGEPTIGGVVGANVSGPRRVQAGACRDFLLGVRFVDGSGTVIKNGGRVMKNVTGYDLARLMCGAHGTLGVLSEVSLKVLPKPEFVVTLIFDGAGHTTSADVLIKAIKSPYEVSGAARVPAGVVGKKGAAIIRLEGFEASVKYRAKALAEKLGGGRYEADQVKNEELWRAVRDVTPFADRRGHVWAVSIKPSDFTCFVGAVPQEDKLVDWACGRIWMITAPGTDIRRMVDETGGHATLVRSDGKTPSRFHPEAEPLASMARALRSKFDPRGILNPGLMS